ncbi:hypothetical protein ACWELJ_32935, partial [Nocardia sp. NPDC004582]
ELPPEGTAVEPPRAVEIPRSFKHELLLKKAAATRPDPVGFEPASISFVSADEGWVLGRTTPCTGAGCPALRHTTDGGRTWQQVPLPAPLREAGAAGGRVTFADARNGWIRAGSTLFATHDGGTGWRAVDLDVHAVNDAWQVTVAADTAYIAAVQPGERPVLFSSPVGGDSWSETADLPVAVGGGPDPAARVAAAGSRAWMVVANRTVAGARLVDGAWLSWKLPCGTNGPADWQALSERRVLALCGRSGPGTSDSATTHLMTSTDGGASFTETGQLTASLSLVAELIPADSTHLVAAVDNRLLASADGGETWTTGYTAPEPGATASAGEFISPTTGFVIMSHHDTPAALLVTRDAGRTWNPVAVD